MRLDAPNPPIYARETLKSTLERATMFQSYPENVVPDRGATKVYVEIGVAVFDSHQTVLLDKRFREEGVIRPVVLHPGHLLSHIRHLHQLRHPGNIIVGRH